jgi:hypothetical protein
VIGFYIAAAVELHEYPAQQIIICAENCLPDTSKASAGFCGVARLCTGRNVTKFAAKANRECFWAELPKMRRIKSRQTCFSTEGAV